MKKTIWALALVIIGCTSCNNLGLFKKNSQDLITGAYVRTINHEFATGTDTIYLTAISGKYNTFGVVKHAVLQRKLDGKMFPRETISDLWVAVYDERTSTLTENKKGKKLFIDLDSSRLLFGPIPYTKIR